MPNENLNDLVGFLAVAREGSFTRAAAKLGVSQSALSQTVRNLEATLGLRLLTRTTRRLSPTEAGERFVQEVGPRIEEIQGQLTSLSELKGKLVGTVRLVSSENAAQAVLWPALRRLLPDYPDIKLEIVIEAGLSDIVAGRYDAGVPAPNHRLRRLGSSGRRPNQSCLASRVLVLALPWPGEGAARSFSHKACAPFRTERRRGSVPTGSAWGADRSLEAPENFVPPRAKAPLRTEREKSGERTFGRLPVLDVRVS